MAFGGGFWAARPHPVTTLKKDRALGADVHKGFVDTFNWMVAWISNFRVGPGLDFEGGDKGQPRIDLNVVDADGVPISDYPDDETPVYDLGGGGSGETLPSAFEAVYTDGVISSCANCIFAAGRTFVDAGTLTISATSSSTGFVILTLTHPTSANASWNAANASLSIEAAIPANTNDSVTKVPLYHVTNGVVDVDLRAIPTAVLAQ